MGRTSDADDRLKHAALELMWEESYGAVTIDDICKRADVKKGSFYYFFDSKAALAVAALEKMWIEEMKPAMDARFSPVVEPLDRLRNYLEAVYARQCESCRQHGKVLGCPVFSVGSEISTQEVDVNAKVREILARKRRYVESAIRDAMAEGTIEPCDPAQKALALACMIEGAVSQARIMNDPELLRNLPALGFDLLRVKAPSASAPVGAVPSGAAAGVAGSAAAPATTAAPP
jgi:TetR/AcrR family transcriptional repressor of nem operon